MHMRNKYKSETMLQKDEVSRWLRELGVAFENGELPGEAGLVSLDGYRGLKLSIKPEFDGRVIVKLSVKFPKDATGAQTECDDEEEFEALPKYSSLKKHMKQTFKAIGAALAAGQIPPTLEAQSFIVDSRLMVSYPGKGDDFYDAYLGKINAFEAALLASDLETLKIVHSELAQLKRDCHSRYA